MAYKADELPTSQWVKEVLDFSSQYGSETSISYTVPNIAGESSIFPNYGDFTQACVLRTYGPWWNKVPSARKCLMRTPQSFISQDFIELGYSKQVYPLKVEIHETYNPGAIVKILACNINPYDDQDKQGDKPVRWVVLWAGSNEQKPAESRITMPDLQECPFPTNLIRLELNSTLCEYYTELDAVSLTGTETYPSWWKPLQSLQNDTDRAKLTSQNNNKQDNITKTETVVKNESANSPVDKMTKELASLYVQDGLTAALEQTNNGHFDLLPDEVIQLIISYLDIPSLCHLSLASRLLYKHCYDPLQYTELNMQPYWAKVTDTSLLGLYTRCSRLQYVNLSWCGGYSNITALGVTRFFKACGADLVSLNLACCRFIENEVIKSIAQSCPNLNDIDLQCCRKIDSVGFVNLTKLPNLRRLILYRTMIDVHSLIAIIRSCPEIEHLNLGSCAGVNSFDDVIIELGKNCKKLKSLDVWRARTFSDVGLHALSANCPLLEELDVGWCFDLRSQSGCIVELVKNCKMLKKLFLTANRTVCDNDLEAIAKHSAMMEQLDILGTREVSQKVTQKVLENCKKLVFFDVSFCSGIDCITVDTWKEQFPQVAIKKSFQA